MEDESKRINEQRRTEFRDEAINPSREAMETGRENNNVDRDRKPVADSKRDSKVTDEEFERAEKEKREKQRRQEERSKEWGE